MGMLRSCTALFSLLARTSSIIVLFNMSLYWTFYYVVVFIICGHNIQFNIADIVKRVHVLQIKPNEVVHLIQHAQHMKWHVITCTKLGYRGPGLNLTCLR